jgi:GMP synthase (glutamine-hydrolysing)
MDKIVVLDCGGQYTHLIARKVRDLGVYSEILPVDCPPAALRGAKGFIISGGPASVYDAGSPQIQPDTFALGLPALGICYGHQLMAHVLNGAVQPGDRREFGATEIEVLDSSTVLHGLAPREPVWMSHGDLVLEPPAGFRVLASTHGCPIAAMGDDARRFYGVQFHVEVTHTPHGRQILSNFLHEICGCGQEWSAGERVATIEEQVRRVAGQRNVFFFVSGGVDSTVAFTLATRALGRERVHGAYIDTGFMRQGETQEIAAAFRGLGYDLEIIDASDQFFKALEGVAEPEAKRQIIGDMFITVQDQAITRLGWGDDWVLGQGTIYPDTIESGGTKSSAKIKTHHNRVGKVAEMILAGRILEPISELYKDEVREVGRKLELPRELIERHPFPGPGLAIRTLCCTEEGVAEALAPIESYCATRLPLRSVGVQGDHRSYAHPTLLWGGLRVHSVLSDVSSQITNTQRESNRVTYLLGCRVPQSSRSWRSHPALLTRERVALLQQADGRVRQWLRDENLTAAVWQFPVVLLPLAAGSGTGETIVLRPVESEDGMTAHVAPLGFAALDRLTEQLLQISGIDAVLLDISHKPPATIEWE